MWGVFPSPFCFSQFINIQVSQLEARLKDTTNALAEARSVNVGGGGFAQCRGGGLYSFDFM